MARRFFARPARNFSERVAAPGVELTRFVCCDLEMTGLDPEHNVIIEMGLIVTGPDLRPLAELERAGVAARAELREKTHNFG
jgi:oligoribonuclease (3'-5' exoribonuclease)